MGSKWLSNSLVVGVALLVVCPVVLAWDAHDLITQYSLTDLAELVHYEEIEITPYTYSDQDDSVYNPDFELEYKLGELGDKVSARQIIATYAPEPDWDLDEALELSARQYLTGGSQGWRHQRFTLLGGIVSLGVAPQRAQHFYDLALVAVDKGDYYWGFRFLARSIHYLQDLSQPLHALPLPISDLLFKYKIDIGAVNIIAKNVHYSVEEYFDYQLRNGVDQLVGAIQGSGTSKIDSVEKAAARENMVARKKAGEMYRLVLEVWPELDVREDVRIPASDYARTEPQADLQQLWGVVTERLGAAGANTRGIVQKFLTDIQLFTNG